MRQNVKQNRIITLDCNASEADLDQRVKMISTVTLSRNWGHLEKSEFELQRRDGTWQRQVRETYDRGNAAVMLLVNPDTDRVILTRQFRFPVYRMGDEPFLIEACAGLLDGAEPEDCARREAEEETGYRASRVRHLFDAYMSPGSVTEKLSFFIGDYDAAARISEGGGLVHEGEDIEVIELGFAEALAMIGAGQIADAKTIMVLQHLALERAGLV